MGDKRFPTPWRRIGTVRAGVLAAGLIAAGAVAGSGAAQVRAQEGTAAPPASVLGVLKIRTSSDNALAADLRRAGVGDDGILAAGEALDAPFPAKPKATGEPPPETGEAREPAGDDVPPAAAPDFDLFEDQDGRPVGRSNLSAAPRPPGSSEPPAGTAPGAPEREAAPGRAGLRDDPRPGEAARKPKDGLHDADADAKADLALPAAPVRTPGLDRLNRRQNLAITGLRPSIPAAADDPFAPVGLRVGRSVLTSRLDQSVGASSNLSEEAGGAGGLFSETRLSARLLSDWSRHESEVNGLLAYRRNFAGAVESDPDLALDGRLRLDIDRLTAATLRGAFEYRREDRIDGGADDASGDRPEVLAASGSAEIARQFGRIEGVLTGSLAREDRARPAGTAGADDSFTTYTAALRTGYDVSPALAPFVEASVGRRLFDEATGADGLERDATLSALRTGLGVDLGEKLRGEAAVGYAWNVPDAGARRTVGAPTLDALVTWSPQRGTDLALTGVTTFDPDSDGSGTSTLYEGALALRHRLTARTDLTATLSAAYRDSREEADIETSYGAEAGFTYWLNRTLALTGLLRHEELDGERASTDYTADSIRLGLRLQR